MNALRTFKLVRDLKLYEYATVEATSLAAARRRADDLAKAPAATRKIRAGATAWKQLP